LRSLTLAPYLNVVGLRRRLTGILAVSLLALLPIPAARAASTFFIRGGGDGHGIGMSQYGAYGYALHGAGYQQILAHYYQGTTLGSAEPNQIVRILLSTGRASFSGAASAAGAVSPTGAGAVSAAGTRLSPAQTYTVKRLANGRLSVLGANGKRVGPTLAPPLSVTGSAPFTVPGHGTFRGALEFEPDGHGGVQTVDALGLDDYVRGVVAEEMPSGWAPQALEAQAVAARTYAITTTVAGNGYGLYDDTRSQMYGGAGAETPATDAAVLATRGQVVTYQGRPVVTYFFASSGGHTEDIENAWPGASPAPWLRGVPDPFDSAGGDPYHAWGEQLSLRTATAKLSGLVKGSLVGITINRHGVSPRIIRATVDGTKGTTTVSGGSLQQAFGLLTTDAAFTSLTTNATATALSGTVFPARRGATYWIQELMPIGWTSIAHGRLTAAGRYTGALPGPGTYRVQFNHLDGPAVTAPTANARAIRAAARRELSALLTLQRGAGPVLPMGRLARYAWPLAGHRRPLRPLPLLLRPAGLDHGRR
jgi:stage II sporulation protein D